jgi:hypothetical protein
VLVLVVVLVLELDAHLDDEHENENEHDDEFDCSEIFSSPSCTIGFHQLEEQQPDGQSHGEVKGGKQE